VRNETNDAVLVIPRERAQDVRAVVDALTARGDADRI
jgi:mannose-1-phosphate guanylyltransferase